MSDVEFAALRSSVPNPAFSAAGRFDPFWLGLWSAGAQASWVSRDVMLRRQTAGYANAAYSVSEERHTKALLSLLSGRNFEQRLAGLSVLAMWRTVTNEQMGAFTGRSFTDRRNDIAALLFDAGVAERGSLADTMRMSRQVPTVHRLAFNKDLDSVIGALTFEESMAVTAGQPVTTGPRHDRHNVMTAELALRIAEFCETGAVLGESVCSRRLFSPNSPASTTTAAADAAIVRSDGLKILVELTATATKRSFADKVSRWVDVMLEYPAGQEPGFMVLFVEAGDPDRRDPNYVWRTLRAGINKAIFGRPEAVRRGLNRFFAAARWRWWFPEPYVASRGFVTLQATRMTGPAKNRWQPAFLLDPIDVGFDPTGVQDPTAVINNSKFLWGSPYWLRGSGCADFTEVILDWAGPDVRRIVDNNRNGSSRI